MNVLSLCDGMSCGQIALKELNIPVDTYYASEIYDKAIEVTQANFPNTDCFDIRNDDWLNKINKICEEHGYN